MSLPTSKWLVGVLIGCTFALTARAEEDVVHLRCETRAKIFDKKSRKNKVAAGFFNGVPLVVDRFRQTMWVGSLVRIPLVVQPKSYKVDYEAKAGVLQMVINRKTGALKAHHEGPRFVQEEQGRCRRHEPTAGPTS